MLMRCLSCTWLAGCLALFSLSAESALAGGNGCCERCPSCGDAAEELRCYGPCCCQPRKTLFQWSCGATFEGGPPGWDEPLVTDRPDFTESSVTVGRGVTQLEMGYTFTSNDDDGIQVDEDSYPETLFRIGMFAEWFELRIGWNYLEEDVSGVGGDARNEGAEDLSIGCKIALTPQVCCAPEMAVILAMTVPTGADVFSADEVLPSFVWAYSWELNDRLALGGNTGFSRELDEVTDESYLQISQSWALGISLTDCVGAYVEYFGLYPSSADTERTQHFFDGGFTFLVNNNFQLDIRGGVGLNEAADDYFVGAGSSFRF